jgi:[ribosomal protein S18]-alanine N-acetyltransferase
MGQLMTPSAEIRTGSIKDIDILERLESKGFDQDRFNRRQLIYLLSRANATTYILEEENHIRGAAIMLWRADSKVGRLYSIVIDPVHHGKGLGKRLLGVCEKDAIRHQCQRLVLEVRADNKPAIALYEKSGYRIAGTIRGYYADGTNGLKMIKPLEIGKGHSHLCPKAPISQ